MDARRNDSVVGLGMSGCVDLRRGQRFHCLVVGGGRHTPKLGGAIPTM